MAIELLRHSGSLRSRRNRELEEVEAEAAVAAHKVRAIGYVTTAAIQSVTQVSVTEAECTKLVPNSALRLAAVGDAGTAAIQCAVLRLGDRL
jgi:hypothetical protein